MRRLSGFRCLTIALLVGLVSDTDGVWKRREDKTKCPKVKGIRNFDISEVRALLWSMYVKIAYSAATRSKDFHIPLWYDRFAITSRLLKQLLHYTCEDCLVCLQWQNTGIIWTCSCFRRARISITNCVEYVVRFHLCVNACAFVIRSVCIAYSLFVSIRNKCKTNRDLFHVENFI